MKYTRFSFGFVVAFALNGLLGCSGVQPGTQSTRTVSIPPGMRAVSVAVKKTSDVAPGSRVDVLVPRESESDTATVLENVKVLASEQEKPESLGVVTLLTSPSDADKIMLASQKGRIQLVPRN
jgi:pilus assembly protein CpaB